MGIIDLIKKIKTELDPVFKSLFYSFLFFGLISLIIILVFALLYYTDKDPLSTLSTNCTKCILFSAATYFDSPYGRNDNIGSNCKFYASLEALSYTILFLIPIGIFIDKISEAVKNKKWKPLEEVVHGELERESENLIDVVNLLFFPTTLDIDRVFPPKNDPKTSYKSPEQISDAYKRIDYKQYEKIKDGIDKSNIKKRIINPMLIKLFKSRSSDLSDLQRKYQDYLEPDITIKMIKIQKYLNWVVQDISMSSSQNSELRL